ncbi:MAG: 3-methyl-2-oxobutanoate hydroxymethyltransferase [Thermodesulfobacteriota bacterium]
MAKTQKTRVSHLAQMKKDGRKIVAVTAYDCSVARIVDSCGVDVVLVGDSLGNVFQGLDGTVAVRMEDMIYHTRAVSRGVERAHLCADMPFLSYQTDDRDAIKNAGNLLKRGGAESVKIEVGARRYTQTVRSLTDAGIPVVAHVGLCPQSVNLYGYKVQGDNPQSAGFIHGLALECREAGAVALVIECVPPALASRITEAVDIPTIGIGSGGGCDGQVLVFNDLVGLSGPVPGFVKKYAEAGEIFATAVESYAREVRDGVFPPPETGE